MSILGGIFGRRDREARYRTVDGGKPAPYPDMTDEQLYNYELAFNVEKKTFDQPPHQGSARRPQAQQEPEIEEKTRRITEATLNRYQLPRREPELVTQHDGREAVNEEKTVMATEAPELQTLRFDDGMPEKQAVEADPPAGAADSDAMQASVVDESVSAEPPLDFAKPIRVITSKQPVEIITTRARHPLYKVHAYVGDEQVMRVFTLDGRMSENGPRFLENIPDREELHLNIYINPDPLSREKYLITQHTSQEDAESKRRPNCIGSCKLEVKPQFTT
ncbi:hypothetical protein SAMN06265795_105210 [Noviherbaspirillum humi]|uniref:Uncharacterized protein n=1 Tax=Noviherbaspirillum humi TaxID=1688639 RepID=A0A239GW84_9BURK|nr:hypothetical protein [Noviherbaspirillum humi]SNS73048.1 hypothetical protein SAMN06265795_105210 [Noviherbaspirillum humi]